MIVGEGIEVGRMDNLHGIEQTLLKIIGGQQQLLILDKLLILLLISGKFV